MEFLLAWLALAVIQLAATISPGPAFAMTVRNAMIYNRRTTLITVIGLGIGVAVHVMLVLGGLATILSQSVWLFNAVKYAGAAYLIYIGVKSIRAKKDMNFPDATNEKEKTTKKKEISDLKALWIGILTNVLNPKAVIFFTALFTQFVAPDTPPHILGLYGTTSVFFEIAWFATVTLVLTNAAVRAKFMGFSHWIERVCGGLLTALGIRLVLP